MAALSQKKQPEPGFFEIRAEAARCRRCDLYRNATQTVFGEGPVPAALMFVGEQPGDSEDIAGRPFVGPAGTLFAEVLKQQGLERDGVYITNAVKHFKFVPRGKRRLHQRPLAEEIHACGHWLAIERQLVMPRLIVALGATAALALTGNGRDILKRRGRMEKDGTGTPVLITYHPSALLRIPDPGARAKARALFAADIKQAAAFVATE